MISAAELAWALDSLCTAGIRARTLGWCLGDILPAELELDARGVRRGELRGPVRQRLSARRRKKHLRQGHDAGCKAIGLPAPAVLRVLDAWDPCGAASLLGEAVTETVTEIDALQHQGRSEWRAQTARELVAFAISARITPRRPTTGSRSARGPAA